MNKPWSSTKLKDVCHKITDGTHKTPIYQDNGIVFLSARNIKNGGLCFSNHKFISEEEHNDLTRRCKPEEGDVLLSKSGSLGDAVVIPKLDFVFSIFESLALLKIKKDILMPSFLNQYLNSPFSKRYFWSITSGIAVKHLHLIDLKEMPIIIPPLKAQKTIVSLLETWDKALKKTEALITAKEKQFELLKNILIDDDVDARKCELSNFSKIAKKEKIITLEGLSPLIVKLHCKGVVANKQDIKIVLSAKGRPYYKRFSGEFLIGRQNFHNGGFGIVPKELNGFIASNAITSLDIDESKLSPEYLFYYLSRKNYYLRIAHIMDGTGQKELSDKQIMKLPVLTTPIEVQQKIVRILNISQKELKLLNQLLQKYRQQKGGLMQKLLSGEWCIKNKEFESA